jgi:hypothetical protein
MTTPPHVLAKRIRTALAGILDAYDAVLVPVTRATGSHATNPTIAPLLVSAQILDVRAHCRARMASLCLMVIDERELHTEHLSALDVPAMADLLDRHADWIGEHEAADVAVRELERSARDLGAIAADSVPKRQDVGPCPGTNNGKPCPGMVRATIRRDDDLLPSTLACSGTPSHEWPAAEWRVLERRLHMNESAARRLAAAIRVEG